MKTIQILCFLLFTSTNLSGQTPCVDGYAGTYPCNQITLLGHLAPDEMQAVLHDGYYLNDIWGWTDPETNFEYALVGLKNGVAFVNVTEPTNPVFLGKLQEPTTSNNRVSEIAHGKSTWRDIKVFKNYAFIVSDLNGQHGLQIFDLTKLRDLTGDEPVTFSHDAHYTEFGSAHNIAINEATGYAYVVGMSSGKEVCAGGLHIIDINDPLNPAFIGCFDADAYTHDAQCVIYSGPDMDYNGKEICFNSNEDTFTIVNVEIKNEPVMISRTGYTNQKYTHQGWLSEDHRFFLQNDELDEMAYAHNPRTLIWNIEDLDHPVLIGDYYNNEPAIDHNLYTHQNLAFESNYFSGLRVMTLDRIDQGMLREVAYFDTYPLKNEIEFGGTWSNYPYFESGTIIVSDMNNGLFVLKLDLQQDIISTHPENWSGCNGDQAKFDIQTNKTDLIYQWQYFNGKDYFNLTDNDKINGSQTNRLFVKASSTQAKYLYRCAMKDPEGHLYYSFTAKMLLESGMHFPVADFNYNINGNGNLTTVNKSSYADSYQWFLNNVLISEEENPLLSTESGLYDIKLIAINECGTDTLSQLVEIITSAGIQSELNLYPNPASDRLYIQSLFEAQMEIYNSAGEKLKNASIEAGENLIELCEFNSGIYFVRIQSAGKTSIRKVVIK